MLSNIAKKEIPQSSAAFLEDMTYSVDCEHLYTMESIHFMQEPRSSANDYVVTVLKIVDSHLREFFGGKFLLQIWKGKERLFQQVHDSRIRENIFCSKTECVYMLQKDSKPFIYTVFPFKKQATKILTPFETSENIKLYCNDEILLIAQH